MKKLLLLLTLCIASLIRVNALVISEIFSNPVGEDNGREWVEVYNDADVAVELSAVSLSVKGATPIVVAAPGLTNRPPPPADVGIPATGASQTNPSGMVRGPDGWMTPGVLSNSTDMALTPCRRCLL